MPIVLNNISYTYSSGTPFETEALKDINLTIEDGEFLGIVGRTGCGKSTLIQLIAGLLRPSEGTLMLHGSDINDKRYNRSELRRMVGVLFQYPESQLFEKTVEKDVAFGLKHSGLSRAETISRVRGALELVGFSFEDVRSKSPLELSGGEKRRVAIAGVLAVQPQILILDEPTAGLDPLGSQAFLHLIGTLHAQGKTVIMISHNADVIAEHATKVLVLEQGRLIMNGPVGEIFSDITRLNKLGLGSSAPRQIALQLFELGLDFPQDIFRYEELMCALVRFAKGRIT